MTGGNFSLDCMPQHPHALARSSFSWLTFRIAIISGCAVSHESHADLKGVSHMCYVMAYKTASRSHHVDGNNINALN